MTKEHLIAVTHEQRLGAGEGLSKLRLALMRGLYLLNFISLAIDNWIIIFFPQEQMDILSGVAISFWASFSLLMLIGIRFPTRMLPLLLLQLLYKSSWIIGTYLPAKSTGLLDANLQSFFWVCIAGIVLNLFIIPWPYVYHRYLKDFFKLR
ncbi:hypothetical protein FNH22_05985 [Fulvivirga sp. M361]|uniref:hypothetical protein n=1 Tax=Fulvivirga sp. M361 TaxID=2594266 RepID=UPI00117B2F1D|nr:hypothetical protein [Fulvivirga sp. M361]TRX60596.1 hypothetical protein FNH22_05985 [Fulvivirga sp. M361]